MQSDMRGKILDQVFERAETVVSGDLAFVRGMEVNRAAPRDGAPPMEVHASFICGSAADLESPPSEKRRGAR